MRIRIQSTNIYTFNDRAVSTLAAVISFIKPLRRADSIGIQEGGRRITPLKKMPGYNLFWKRGISRHTKNNPILLDKRRGFLKKKYFKVAAGAGTKVTPPRNVFVVFYRKGPVKVAHINTHFHVVPEEDLAYRDESEYGKAARQYRDHVMFVRQLMKQYKREGFVVFVTADGNTRPRDGVKDWKYSAYRYLPRDSFGIRRNELDFIIHDKDLVRVTAFKVIPKAHLGKADHDSLFGEYELR